MAVVSVNPGPIRPREPSTLENIALGVDVAAKILGTGIDAYKTFGIERPKLKMMEDAAKVDAESAKLKGARDAQSAEEQFAEKWIPAQAGEKGTQIISGRQGQYKFREKAEDPYLQALKLQLMQGQLSGQKTSSKKAEIELKHAEEVEKYGKPLAANTIEQLSSAKLLPKKLTEINEIIEKNADLFGPVEGTIGAINPYDTKAQTISGKMRTSAQEIGKYMEGGVLRKEDEAKYQKMLPQLGDTAEVAKNKAAMVQKMLFDKFMSDYTAFKESGFDTRAFDSSPMKQLTQPEFLMPGAQNAPAQSKPQFVIQNGVQYKLNPQTGEYE